MFKLFRKKPAQTEDTPKHKFSQKLEIEGFDKSVIEYTYLRIKYLLDSLEKSSASFEDIYHPKLDGVDFAEFITGVEKDYSTPEYTQEDDDLLLAKYSLNDARYYAEAMQLLLNKKVLQTSTISQI